MSTSSHEYASIDVTHLPFAKKERMRLIFYCVAADVNFTFSDSTRIPANRTILSLYSEVFQKMFFCENPHQKEFIMLNTLPRDFRLFLDSVIGITSLTVGQALTVFPFAMKYEVQSLKETCETIFETENLTDYIIQALDIGIAFNSDKILRACVETIKKIGPASVFTEPNISSYLTPQNLEVVFQFFPPTSKPVVQALFQWASAMRKPKHSPNTRSFLKSWNIWSKINFDKFNVLELKEFMELECVQDVFSCEEREMYFQKIFNDKLNISLEPSTIQVRKGTVITEEFKVQLRPPTEQMNFKIIMHAPIDVCFPSIGESEKALSKSDLGSVEAISLHNESDDPFLYPKPPDPMNRVDIATYATFGINHKKKLLTKQMSLDSSGKLKNNNFSRSLSQFDCSVPQKPIIPSKPKMKSNEIPKIKPQGTALRILRNSSHETLECSSQRNSQLIEVLPSRSLKEVENSLRIMLESCNSEEVSGNLSNMNEADSHACNMKSSTQKHPESSGESDLKRDIEIKPHTSNYHKKETKNQNTDKIINTNENRFSNANNHIMPMRNKFAQNDYNQITDKDFNTLLVGSSKGNFSRGSCNRQSLFNKERKLLPPPPPPPKRKIPKTNVINNLRENASNELNNMPSNIFKSTGINHSISGTGQFLPNGCNINEQKILYEEAKPFRSSSEYALSSTNSLPPKRKPAKLKRPELNIFESRTTSTPTLLFESTSYRELVSSQTSFEEKSKTALRNPDSSANVAKFGKGPEGSYVKCVVTLMYRDAGFSTKEVRLSRSETILVGNSLVFRFLETLEGSLIHCIDQVRVEYRFNSPGTYVKCYPAFALTSEIDTKFLTKTFEFE